jgi:hypothetical protein
MNLRLSGLYAEREQIESGKQEIELLLLMFYTFASIIPSGEAGWGAKLTIGIRNFILQRSQI